MAGIVHTVLTPESLQVLKKAVQQGRSEVHDAKNMSVTSVDGRESVSAQCLKGEA